MLTSNGVGVIDGRKKAYALVKSKIGVVSGVISSTESESEDPVYESVAYNPVKTGLSESEADAKEPTNREA